METVKFWIDGKEYVKTFNNITDAIKYQEGLLYWRGIDAEVQ